MKLKFKISKQRLKSLFLIICLYHLFFVRWQYVQSYEAIKYGLLMTIGFAMLLNIKLLLSHRYIKINIILLMFCLIVLISSGLSEKLVDGSILRGILFAGTMLEIVFLIEYLDCKKQLNLLFCTFFKLSFIYAILTDIFMFILPNLYFINKSNYLIGNKFIVTYMHLYVLIFYYINNSVQIKNYSKIIMLLLIYIWTFAISIYTECSTGIIGCVIIILLAFRKYEWYSAKKWIIILGISDTIFILFNKFILSLPLVQHIILNVLGETLDLHGRLQIYDNVLPIINEHFWLGYGANNYYEILYSLIKAPNTQNGILNIMFQFGLLGTVIFIILMYIFAKKGEKIMENKGVFILITVLTIFSSIEITLNMYFFFFMALLWANSLNKKGEKECQSL